MPTRRTLLVLAGSGASLALAGCSALEDDSSEDNNQNGNPDTNPGTESPSAADPPDTDSPAGVPARKAATNYDIGHGEFETALETFRDASDMYGRGEYAPCIVKMGEAERSFNSAQESFGQALAELAGTEAPEEAVEACNTARESAANGWKASDTFKLAARVAQRGQIQLADDQADTARSTLRESGEADAPLVVRSLLNAN